MNLFRAFVLALIAFPAAALAWPWQDAPSQETPQIQYMNRKPLMVIRFNQRNLHFERQLYSTLEQAVRIKPDVRFDVVALAPESASGGDLDGVGGTVSQDGERVVNSLVQMGVPKSRMRYAHYSDPNLRYGEVRIFVR